MSVNRQAFDGTGPRIHFRAQNAPQTGVLESYRRFANTNKRPLIDAQFGGVLVTMPHAAHIVQFTSLTPFKNDQMARHFMAIGEPRDAANDAVELAKLLGQSVTLVKDPRDPSTIQKLTVSAKANPNNVADWLAAK